ncbi:hypothetical protein [Bradyrhizobium embrapense]
MKHFRFDVRCIDGRLFQHIAQNDDPDFERDIGRCEDCNGAGCDRLHRQAAEAKVGDKIVCTHVFPPIPDRRYDWCATRDSDEPDDSGHMFQGFGSTAQDAIDDLVAVIEDARG